jgi:hypothetical protein
MTSHLSPCNSQRGRSRTFLFLLLPLARVLRRRQLRSVAAVLAASLLPSTVHHLIHLVVAAVFPLPPPCSSSWSSGSGCSASLKKTYFFRCNAKMPSPCLPRAYQPDFVGPSALPFRRDRVELKPRRSLNPRKRTLPVRVKWRGDRVVARTGLDFCIFGYFNLNTTIKRSILFSFISCPAWHKLERGTRRGET